MFFADFFSMKSSMNDQSYIWSKEMWVTILNTELKSGLHFKNSLILHYDLDKSNLIKNNIFWYVTFQEM